MKEIEGATGSLDESMPAKQGSILLTARVNERRQNSQSVKKLEFAFGQQHRRLMMMREHGQAKGLRINRKAGAN